VQRHCGLIVAVGDVGVRTAQSVAAASTGTDFVLVGGGSSALAVVSAGSVADVAARVASVVRAAVGGGFHAGVVS
jgi:hypothetical protein